MTAFLISAVFLVNVSFASAATLKLVPSTGTFNVGDIFTVDIELDTTGDTVSGVDIDALHYNQTLLEVQDAPPPDGLDPGVQITTGPILDSTYGNAYNKVDDPDPGTIRFSKVGFPEYTDKDGIFHPLTLFDGVGTLATISFKVLAAGSDTLTFDFVLGDPLDTNVVTTAETDVLQSVSGGTYTLLAQSSTFTIGDYVVTNTSLNVRDAPNGGTVGPAQPAGTKGVVVGGPVFANVDWWWNINYVGSVDGWSIEDGLDPTTNTAPVVSAGSNQGITLPNTATLNGSVSDDGLINSPVSITWSQVSGPSVTSFGNANVANTTATFSLAGTYVLRLTGNDGEFSNFSDTTVTVSEAFLSNVTFQLGLEGKPNINLRTFSIEIFNIGSNTAVSSYSDTADSASRVLIEQNKISQGSYDVRYDYPNYLSRKRSGISIFENDNVVLQPLLAGDLAANDDLVNSLDWSVMNGDWFTAIQPSDINIDGIVNSIDFSFLNDN